MIKGTDWADLESLEKDGDFVIVTSVGATVLLVPLRVDIALGAGANPALFALNLVF